ncbi:MULTISPECIES: M56 family metallopeptidase [Streptomyces]|uniref:M56 family metallopeptidase n=1 Tax=Streptomyces TaxID=1883 RepID=UPI000F54F1DC|nr:MULTISPECIES: M56 family metallopeptidase [Streptomyces]MDX3061802.1 M56 family metallopeptidase [Streptomyces sp. ND04-05B]RPK72635.1 Protease HtpX [Streptomyces sp. ADI97-07]WRY80498.1 M56 family metallopeptidase [Streptomyces clavifer]WUC26276.1 M56 family metallopeptidase [Streptomyces clavifer]
MGVFVFLPLVLPLTAWPVARLAAHHLHPRTATWLLSAVAAVLAVCSTLCLALLVVVGTAQLPGNPLPDGWSDPEVREAVPYDEVAGKAAIPVLVAVLAACVSAAWRHHRVRRDAERALTGLPDTPVAVLPDEAPYAYALPGPKGRIVVSTSLLSCLDSSERRALFAHERAHLAGRHHRFLLIVQLAARANPFLRPLRTAVAYTAERWADEDAAAAVGNRRVVARAIGRAALVSRGAPGVTLAGLAAPGPVPRRVAALLGPAPAARVWPPVFTAVGLAAWAAAAGTTVSALSSANAAVTLFFVLKTATPL